MDVAFKTICEIGVSLRNGEFSSIELTHHMLDRIDRFNGTLNAFITVAEKRAMKEAEAADRDFANGIDRGPMQGVPVAVKDLFATKDVLTTCGSLLYADHVPDFDAAVIEKVRESGAVMIGKTGMHELANGNSSINPHYGAIRNPWALGRDPGGSSGGSSSAVAAGLAFTALGSDTACSVRQPAHSCGIVGLKPTFGLISKFGAKELAWSLDHVGPLTRNVGDAALMLDVLAGYDARDFFSKPDSDNSSYQLKVQPSKPTKIALMRRFFFEGDPDVIGIIEKAVETIAHDGVEVIEIDIPDVEKAYDAAMITFAETAAIFHDEFQESPHLFSEELQRKIRSSTAISRDDYLAAQRFRADFTGQMDELFSSFDAFVVPTSAFAARPLENRAADPEGFAIRNCSIFNLTGQPAISIPCGLTRDGLPVGLMIAGPRLTDRKVLQVAHYFEELLAFQARPSALDLI